MKNSVQIPVCIFFILLSISLSAQFTSYDNNAIPYKGNRSVLFGTDIIINDQPIQNQKTVAQCAALNGWLYAAYSYDKSGIAYISVMRSIDNGINWTLLFDGGMGLHNTIFTKIELVTGGNTIDGIKLFIGAMYYDTINHGSTALLVRINGETGVNEGTLWNNVAGEIKDIALATDQPYHANNSNPYSIGFVYTRVYLDKDSIIFRSSSNGGLYFDNYQVLAAGEGYFHNVDLAYGRSTAFPDGGYFATWEQKSTTSSKYGHIYSSHSWPNFNSPFTDPVCLDSIDISAINMCRNPVIACQYSDTDNDSSNLTQIVLFEKFKPGDLDYDVVGCYNLKASSNGPFNLMNVATSVNNELYPDIAFNPYDSTFMVTYFDSTGLKLPFVVNNFNMADPNFWTVVSPGYNDNTNSSAPYPNVSLDFSKGAGCVVWNSGQTGNNGAAMFDAEYIYYTGASENRQNEFAKLFMVYPNPCSSSVTIAFELHNTERVTIILYSIVGQPLRILTDNQYEKGTHEINSDLSNLSEGIYNCFFKVGDFTSNNRISVVK